MADARTLAVSTDGYGGLLTIPVNGIGDVDGRCLGWALR